MDLHTSFVLRAACIASAALISACGTNRPSPPAAQGPSAPTSAVAPAPQAQHPLTLEAYKKTVAERIARASPDIFAEPLPEMFKSIVVLDITIDREGRLSKVSVRRSNGYKALENRALESVKRAAPFVAPAFTVRGRDGSVNFLETFLFRDDGRFRIRSLIQQS